MNLMTMIPPSWQKSPELAEIQRVAGKLCGELEDALDFVWAQLDIERATVGLVFWERTVGIKTDLSLSLDLRRSKVKAKLQGLGVTTPEVIRAIVERFTGGAARVEEHPSEYWFRVIIEGLLNPPESMAEMRASIAEIKPAHLDHEYTLRYQSGQLPVGVIMAVQQVRHYHFGLEVASNG